MTQNEIFAFLLTLAAGISTGIGGVITLFSKNRTSRFLAGSLGFSAGVMVYISMVEIFAKSREFLQAPLGIKNGYWAAAASFFVGILLIAMIDYFIPSAESDIGHTKDNSALKRMGLLTALAIGVHNFPEGMTTFTSAVKDPHLGIAIAIAIAIHNIPEGIATAAPIYCSGGSRKHAAAVAFISGLTEPLGALIGYLLLRPFFSDMMFGILFGMVAGMMIFISIEELLPMARSYEKSSVTIIGFVTGMMVISSSLILFS